MRIPHRIATLGAAIAAALLVTTATATPTSASTSIAGFGEICYSALPPEAHTTLRLIESDGPFPYPQDGGVFQNREGLLPQQPSAYYHEYTVKTPGASNRGTRRIVTGEQHQEDYYTRDHYASFDLVDHGC
ncbi:ribonuclease domain-containing protein [Streptomyces sp. NPDC047315]|uniref:ribonuclease domain-containing protein n=1 Tax=Streptomyces sp. NPDC047315 TaxID=3155142 RepID=UPI0034039650